MLSRKQVSTLAVVVILALAVVACGRSSEPTVAVPPDPTDTPAAVEAPSPTATPEWSPQLLLRLEYQHETGLHTVNSLVFSPGGETLAAGVTGGEALLWNVSDGSLVRSIEHRHSVDDLAFSPDGDLLGAGQGYFGVQLNRVQDGEEHL